MILELIRHPYSIAVLVSALIGLVFVLGGCIGLIIAYARREKLKWGRAMRAIVGIGGVITAGLFLFLPAAVSWFVYTQAPDRMEEALASSAPEQKAALMADIISEAWSAAFLANVSALVLLIPCAVLVGLALTVTFYLEEGS